MKKTLWMVVLMVAAVGVVGCSDSQEKVYEDQLDLMEDTVGILEGVTDKESAEEAKPKLESLKKVSEELQARAKKLGEPTEEEQKELQEKYGKKMAEVANKMMTEMMRVQSNPETKSAVEGVMPPVSAPKIEMPTFKLPG
jgi:chromosome segregation ATPase